MYLLSLFQQQCFSLEPHCSHKIDYCLTARQHTKAILHRSSHKIKTRIIIPSIQNQNSFLVKWQTDFIIPGGDGRVDREVRRLVPSSHKRSECRHKIILHPDSLREKAIQIAFVSAEGI